MSLTSTSPYAFEPLLPEHTRRELATAAQSVVAKSLRLTGMCHASTIERVRTLVRSMNSYYSNKIEGQGTHPHDIEAALRSNYASEPERARLQRLARAHIEAEIELEASLPSTRAPEAALTFDFLRRAHAALYSRLSPDERMTPGARGAPPVKVEPGAFRTSDVSVGRHVPPPWETIEAFARRFDAVYSRDQSFEQTVIATGAAHHRASWVHPFRDGNGRAVRLQTHCALFPLSGGLWSVSRGMARSQRAYYERLDAADAPRAGDLDGRGARSERALAEWCGWFISLCDDQVSFMAKMLGFDTMRDRFRSLIGARAALDNAYRPDIVEPWIHAFATGPLGRGDFQRMSGLHERTARDALATLLRAGLLTSDGHRQPVRVAFPLDALNLLFPDLYPEAATTAG